MTPEEQRVVTHINDETARIQEQNALLKHALTRLDAIEAKSKAFFDKDGDSHLICLIEQIFEHQLTIASEIATASDKLTRIRAASVAILTRHLERCKSVGLDCARVERLIQSLRNTLP